jgi:hypothetical protein
MTSECGSESSERGRKVTRLEVADADGDEEPKLLVGMEDGTVQIVNALTGEPKARSSASGSAVVGFYRDGEDLLVLHANGQVDLLKAGSTAMSAPEYLIDARDWNGRETARLVVRAIPEMTRAEAWGGQVSVEGGGFIELRVRSREGRASAPGVTVDGAGFAVEAGQPMPDIAMELTEVAASPNNGWMYILSHDGEELTRFQGTAGYAVLDGLQALDVDGDGRRTVFSFSSSGSFGYGWDCELDGTSTRFNTDGWPSQLRDAAMVDFAGDGGVGFTHGTSRGNVYYRKSADGVLDNRKVFAAGSGLSAIAGISREGQPGLVAVGLEMSYVHLLDADGKLLWSAPTGAPVTDLVFTAGDSPMLVVGTSSGMVLFFDDAGRQLGRFVAGDRVTVVAESNGGVLAAGADGMVRSLRVSRAINDR